MKKGGAASSTKMKWSFDEEERNHPCAADGTVNKTFDGATEDLRRSEMKSISAHGLDLHLLVGWKWRKSWTKDPRSDPGAPWNAKNENSKMMMYSSGGKAKAAGHPTKAMRRSLFCANDESDGRALQWKNSNVS
jgi:hypothetical protein